MLVLGALTQATGNAVTAARIARHVGSAHRVIVRDVNTSTACELRALVDAEEIDAAIGVHALLSGGFLRTLGVPYALVFGGTDLYEPVHPLQHKQMTAAVKAATWLVAFSEENRARATSMWSREVDVVPQAVDVSGIDDDYSLRAQLRLPNGEPMVLLPTALRRVKDPTFAIDAFASRAPRAHLVVVGTILEPDYADAALATARAHGSLR